MNSYNSSPDIHIIKALSLGAAWTACMEKILKYGKMIQDENETIFEILDLYISIQSIDESDDIIFKYSNRDRINLMIEKYTSCNIVANYKISYGKLIYDN